MTRDELLRISNSDPRWNELASNTASRCKAIVVNKHEYQTGQRPAVDLAVTVARIVLQIVDVSTGRTIANPEDLWNRFTQTVPTAPWGVVLLSYEHSAKSPRERFEILLHEFVHVEEGKRSFLSGRGIEYAEQGPMWLEYLRSEGYRARAEGAAHSAVPEFNLLGGWWVPERDADGIPRLEGAANIADSACDSLRAYGIGDSDRQIAKSVVNSRVITALDAGVASTEAAVIALDEARKLGLAL